MWNSAVQVNEFRHRLEGYMNDELVSHTVPSSLNAVVEVVNWVDQQVLPGRRSAGRHLIVTCLLVHLKGNTSDRLTRPLLSHHPVRAGAHATGLDFTYPRKKGGVANSPTSACTVGLRVNSLLPVWKNSILKFFWCWWSPDQQTGGTEASSG